jgi:hypothetical protein
MTYLAQNYYHLLSSEPKVGRISCFFSNFRVDGSKHLPEKFATFLSTISDRAWTAEGTFEYDIRAVLTLAKGWMFDDGMA